MVVLQAEGSNHSQEGEDESPRPRAFITPPQRMVSWQVKLASKDIVSMCEYPPAEGRSLAYEGATETRTALAAPVIMFLAFIFVTQYEVEALPGCMPTEPLSVLAG